MPVPETSTPPSGVSRCTSRSPPLRSPCPPRKASAAAQLTRPLTPHACTPAGLRPQTSGLPLQWRAQRSCAAAARATAPAAGPAICGSWHRPAARGAPPRRSWPCCCCAAPWAARWPLWPPRGPRWCRTRCVGAKWGPCAGCCRCSCQRPEAAVKLEGAMRAIVCRCTTARSRPTNWRCLRPAWSLRGPCCAQSPPCSLPTAPPRATRTPSAMCLATPSAQRLRCAPLSGLRRGLAPRAVSSLPAAAHRHLSRLPADAGLHAVPSHVHGLHRGARGGHPAQWHDSRNAAGRCAVRRPVGGWRGAAAHVGVLP